MRIEHFRYLFNRLNGFYLKKHIIVFRKPLEIWNEQTGESVNFKSVDELLDYEIDGETVRKIIESQETLYVPPLEGGGVEPGEEKRHSNSTMLVMAGRIRARAFFQLMRIPESSPRPLKGL